MGLISIPYFQGKQMEVQIEFFFKFARKTGPVKFKKLLKVRMGFPISTLQNLGKNSLTILLNKNP